MDINLRRDKYATRCKRILRLTAGQQPFFPGIIEILSRFKEAPPNVGNYIAARDIHIFLLRRQSSENGIVHNLPSAGESGQFFLQEVRETNSFT